ncbi:uncharacterized protein LOC116375907 [Oncorhynchus kisutch]|uniref:uncharacterized protein LOC116375907 n=1 Tax=Oncorhynchus kisutch TaxID=8019 RepID=UPI0012DEA68B|nr:uncharacterized protein LOC116375907 [Oncorhynchus kisutch]XP_031690392.1 uncharacterized protein LOC116375907 [Oncorhynchus kisutch]
MSQPSRHWQSERGDRSDDFWRHLKEEEERGEDVMLQRTGEEMRPSITLRPPPLFRSIGPSGLSASLPPHRRLRSIFRRSRAVLPANTHAGKVSGTHTLQDLLSGTHINTLPHQLTPNDVVSEKDVHINTDSETQTQPKRLMSAHGLTVLEPPTGPLTDTLSFIVSAKSRQQGGQPFFQLSPPLRTHIKGRARWGRAVSPLKMRDDLGTGEGGVKEKQKRRRLDWKGEDQANDRYVSSFTPETEGDGGLCQWLQSLEIGDREKEAISPNSSKQQPSGFRERMARHREGYSHPAANHRRDRRPHFLPPICQSGSLLHVPLLLPKNSPPPSPCTSPHAPFHPLPVPLLHPLPFRRK